MAIMRGESGKEGSLGVEEATVVGAGEEADGLGVEDAVGLVVHAAAHEEEGESRPNESAVHGV